MGIPSRAPSAGWDKLQPYCGAMSDQAIGACGTEPNSAPSHSFQIRNLPRIINFAHSLLKSCRITVKPRVLTSIHPVGGTLWAILNVGSRPAPQWSPSKHQFKNLMNVSVNRFAGTLTV